MCSSVQQLFVKEADIAKMLGRDVKWLRSNGGTLERKYGFAKIDPAIGMRHREAVEECGQQCCGDSCQTRLRTQQVYPHEYRVLICVDLETYISL